MATGGIQTHDFLTRLKKAEDTLPPLLLELSRVMARMIEEVTTPQIEDIRELHQQLLCLIGDAAELRAICGTEGEYCGQCPFGAYLPSGFPHASENQALCLPWIVVVHPMPEGPPVDSD